MAHLPSITFNKETIAFLMGIIGLVSACIGGYNWLLSGRAENAPLVKEITVNIEKDKTAQALKDQEQDVRLDRTDRDRVRQTEATKELTGETKRLNDAVVKLTTVLEQSLATKKADYVPTPHDYPARTISIGAQ